MATRAPFLSQSYGAYYHREVPKEDEELTHVGPGTPCGEYLRRFWQPVALSKDLQELPRRVRILGEDLVVFRDKRGQVGCLELHCPHRGTSLEFGLIAEKGIRCCYHGWLMDVDGRILDTPGEPADSTLKDRLCHGAYPTHEYQGMVFAYMGPPEKEPAFPILDTYHRPGCHMIPLMQHFYPCNWLQIQENVMDPAHLEFLHTITGSHFPEELRMHSVLDWMESPSGMICFATWRVDENIWVRINEYIPPNARQFPSGGPSARQVHVYRARHTHFTVPVDDHHTMVMGFVRLGAGQEEPRGPGFGQTADRPYEERQRVPGDYDAQTSIHWGFSRHRLGTPDHHRSWHHHVEEYRQAWHQRARDVEGGAGHPDLLQPYHHTRPQGAYARGRRTAAARNGAPRGRRLPQRPLVARGAYPVARKHRRCPSPHRTG